MEPSDPKKPRDAEASETPTPAPFFPDKAETSEPEASTPDTLADDAASASSRGQATIDDKLGQADASATSPDEEDPLPSTVAELRTSLSTDPDVADAETERAAPPAGASKGATLSKPPSDSAAEPASTDVEASEKPERSTETEASTPKASETKGAILHEPPDVARSFAATGEESDEERAPEPETAAEAEPVADAEPVIDLPEEDEAPVAEAEPVIGLPPENDSLDETELVDADEPTIETEMIQTEPVVETEPVGRALDLDASEEDENAAWAEDDTKRSALDDVAAPAVGMAAGAAGAGAAAAGREEARRDKAGRDEDADDTSALEEPTPHAETFEAASSDEPERVHDTLEPASPAAAAPAAASAVDAPKADVGKRFIAYIIDAVLATLLGLIPSVGGILGAIYFIIRDGLDVDFMQQRSLGKKLMKLRPVRLDGQPMDLEASFKRNWMFGLGALGSIPFIGGFLAILVVVPALAIGLYELYRVFTDPEGRRWGDDLAGTKVIEVDE